MKSIQFLGAAGEVTGSSYLLTGHDDSSIVIDLGLFQGSKEITDHNYDPLGFRPSDIKGVFLTHAHLDHGGRLPLLVFGGYFGKIYMTAPTAALLALSLTDAAKIAQETFDHAPLYGMEEVEKVLEMIEIVEYGKQFQVGGFSITFRDAGHILGSASIEVVDTSDKQKIVFSGDLGNTPEDIVKPTEYIESADIVVMESTYGDSTHPKEDPTEILGQELQKIDQAGGVLLIPAFSLERTQEVLHRIHHLKKDGKIRGDTPVFLDSPMGIRATLIFREFKTFYNKEMQSHTDDPFGFEGLVVTEDAKDSKAIIKAMEPKAIIAGSGMMSGGRILHHALNYLSDPKTTVLFVGYQAEETAGRKILEGARNVRIYDKNVQVKAAIREIKTLSSHADSPKLLDWVSHIKNVKKVFLVHGEEKQRQALADKIKGVGITDIILPQLGGQHSLTAKTKE